MNVPKIDLTSLPGLDIATGMFGSTAQSGTTYDDRIVAIMVYVYESVPPENLI